MELITSRSLLTLCNLFKNVAAHETVLVSRFPMKNNNIYDRFIIEKWHCQWQCELRSYMLHFRPNYNNTYIYWLVQFEKRISTK